MTAAEPPLVSCVVPVRDGEQYLGEAIDSLLAQGHRPLEIIVVDDGSTDASAALAAAYGSPVRVVAQVTAGPPAARNAGILAAGGAFIALLDADDLLVGDRITRQLERFAARPDLEVCLGYGENFWEPGMVDEEARYRATGKSLGAFHFGTMLTRRRVFDRVGLMNTRLVHGDQIDWFDRVREAGVIVEVLDEVVMRRRMHPASMTHRPHDPAAYLDIVKARLDRRRGRPPDAG